MSVIINNHPFYKDPRFLTDKKILEGLTEICSFSTEVGVLNYFKSSTEIKIGLLDEEVENKEEKIPKFKKGEYISIFLNGDLDSR